MKKIIMFIGMFMLLANLIVLAQTIEIDARCELKAESSGACMEYKEGYQYDSSSGKCDKVGLSGCNFEFPFDSLEECQKVCIQETVECPVDCTCDSQGNIIVCEEPACPADCVCDSQGNVIECEVIECPVNCRCDSQGNAITCEEPACPANCVCDSQGNIIECGVVECPVKCRCDSQGNAITCEEPACPADCVCDSQGNVIECEVIECPARCKCDSRGNVIICVKETDMDTCLDDPSNYWDQETNRCYSGYSERITIKSLCSDPDGGKNIYAGAHTFGFRSTYADSRDKRIRTGGMDACTSDRQLVEHYCDDNGFIQTAYIDCPNSCMIESGACKKGERVIQEVKCIFDESESEQECYAAGIYGGSGCRGIKECTTEISGYQGEEITWKSSCGGYAYTVIGENEYAKFDCSSGEIEPVRIRNKGFRNAYWKCYDGDAEKQGSDSSCKSSETWQKYAKEYCSGHCYADKSKCGVNSFSVSNECYLYELIQPTMVILPAEEVEEEILPSVVIMPAVEEPVLTDEEILICRDSCPLDGKCYPFGYRKKGEYCSDEGGFAEQLEAESPCDNNFECKSNLCIDGECISGGLFRRIINWFKNLFG